MPHRQDSGSLRTLTHSSDDFFVEGASSCAGPNQYSRFDPLDYLQQIVLSLGPFSDLLLIFVLPDETLVDPLSDFVRDTLLEKSVLVYQENQLVGLIFREPIENGRVSYLSCDTESSGTGSEADDPLFRELSLRHSKSRLDCSKLLENIA